MSDKSSRKIQDVDPLETKEWLESLQSTQSTFGQTSGSTVLGGVGGQAMHRRCVSKGSWEEVVK